MSTKKDGVKTSSSSLSKKKSTSLSKTSTRTREESTDRSNVKKTEVPVKTKIKPTLLTNIKDKNVDSNRIKSQNSKTEKPKPLKASPSPHDTKKNSGTTTKVIKRNIKPAVPITPPSNRVSKMQFFPSKNMYSNALKTETVTGTTREITKDDIKTKKSSNKKTEETIKKINSKEVSNERSAGNISIHKTNVKEDGDTYRVQEKNKSKDISPDSSSLSDRPRTATLRKGSIVNDNIVGPDIPKQLVPKNIREIVKMKAASPDIDKTDEYNYEDDFESYESDFEEYSSSSSTDLNDISGEETSSVSTKDSSKSVTSPTEFTSTQRRINSAGADEERKLDSGNFDLPDYKHTQILDKIRESVEKENANLKMQDLQRNNPASLSDEGFEDQKSIQFINFLDAKKKCEHRKSMEIKRKRGEEILNMIRLDTYSFTLFDLSPVPYDIFIKSYGRSNTIQTAVQTGEDNISEEIQTEEIISESKWTQFPTHFSKMDPTDADYLQIYKCNYLGVGGGDNTNVDKATKPLINEHYLRKFLLSAGDLILKILTETSLNKYEQSQKNSRDIPFSSGYIPFNTTKDILKYRSVKCVSFCYDNSNKIMTVHIRKKEEVNGNESVVCIWNIFNSDNPESIFVSYGKISCCSFGLNCADIIFAGLNDGTISVWDTKRNIYNEDSILKMIPLCTTEIGVGHNSDIISLQPFSNQVENSTHFQSSQTNEICSLDEGGDIILWSLIIKNGSMKKSQTSSTNWNDVVLVKNTKVSLKTLYPELEDLQCTDFVLNSMNSNYIIVSTNYGFIIHHLIKGGRSNVKKFVPESQSYANCLEVCPFSSSYFFAGFSDGNINLYSRMVEKPLMVLSDKEGQLGRNSIQIIQWSRSRPFVIYTKDITNTIHIWDLNESDIYPIFSIPFEKNIVCMKLSPLEVDNNIKKSYMMIGTEDGDLYLHVLNGEHGQQPYQTYKEHVNTFLKYVNRL